MMTEERLVEIEALVAARSTAHVRELLSAYKALQAAHKETLREHFHIVSEMHENHSEEIAEYKELLQEVREKIPGLTQESRETATRVFLDFLERSAREGLATVAKLREMPADQALQSLTPRVST